jgi:hypothetical protein
LIKTINLYCQRTETYIIEVLEFMAVFYFISGVTVYHAGIGDVQSPSCAGVMTIFRFSGNFTYLDSTGNFTGRGVDILLRYLDHTHRHHCNNMTLAWF